MTLKSVYDFSEKANTCYAIGEQSETISMSCIKGDTDC